MKKLLHIIATPKKEGSRTLQVSESFLNEFKNKYPECLIDTLNVFEEDLPELTQKRVEGKYILMAGENLEGDIKSSWVEIEKHIERFKSADMYLISTPMWNFGIPYKLKQYIDIIFQPGYLFRYTEEGVDGLIKDKKMVIITTRGGDYSPSSPGHSSDHQEPYLRTAFGFVGQSDIHFINAQPMDALGPEVQKEKIESAKTTAKNLAKNI